MIDLKNKGKISVASEYIWIYFVIKALYFRVCQCLNKK